MLWYRFGATPEQVAVLSARGERDGWGMIRYELSERACGFTLLSIDDYKLQPHVLVEYLFSNTSFGREIPSDFLKDLVSL